ncbi:hypothetical protein A3J15_03995 [Candidatus Roizmanbacteria bacterium RIFCSPLOWO2_02_FULL_38_10]|uniref:PDZ domain-containing protein n=1 Tax=Candidatus Roizmanbacteria bacterium RIFCSPLOWO2_02_FULL_38_10 TaxID=1802074 RepID=A0A1F7JJV3_9BACT|nr:MAG: hypothetical protein A3J15_03995 [Candidatus Roizmanbacteria bacterium RIFCSPLOWO2_02_FULL_38_10]
MKKIGLKKITDFLFILALATLLVGVGFKLGQLSTNNYFVKSHTYGLINLDKDKEKAAQLDFSLFWDVWEKVSDKFVSRDKINYQKMYYGAIKGMVSALDDPYTVFLTPDENKASKDDLVGLFEGIGTQLGLKNGEIVIIAPLKKSPAEAAGLRAGDIIKKVDGQSTANWSLFQAVSKIRGKRGTKVNLTLTRKEKEFSVEITRQEIKVSSVEIEYDKDIALLRLTRFGEDTNNQWDNAVSEINDKWNQGKIKALILDLRDNPGGYLDSSVYVTSEFLAEEQLIVKQEYYDKRSENHVVKRQGKLLSIPLYVLINKGSASASEIVAGSLRDHKRAKLIGETTFGKGSIQEALDLNQGAGLHVTIAKWILPNGDWINSKGVSPDIKIANKEDEDNTITKDSDLQLQSAISEVEKLNR